MKIHDLFIGALVQFGNEFGTIIAINSKTKTVTIQNSTEHIVLVDVVQPVLLTDALMNLNEFTKINSMFKITVGMTSVSIFRSLAGTGYQIYSYYNAVCCGFHKYDIHYVHELQKILIMLHLESYSESFVLAE